MRVLFVGGSQARRSELLGIFLVGCLAPVVVVDVIIAVVVGFHGIGIGIVIGIVSAASGSELLGMFLVWCYIEIVIVVGFLCFPKFRVQNDS